MKAAFVVSVLLRGSHNGVERPQENFVESRPRWCV